MKRNVLGLIVVAILMLGASSLAHASHQLGGNISWVRDQTFQSTTDAKFNIHIELPFRWDFPWAPAPRPPLNTTFSEDGTGFFHFTYGSPSQQKDVQFTVATISAQQNWMVGTGDTTITVPLSSLPITFGIQDCCRASTLADGNNDKNLQLATVITNASGATRSPISTSLPRIYGQMNAPLSFPLPSISVDGLPNQFRFATSAESGLFTPAPSGFTISPSGQVNWIPAATGLYAVQFAVENATGAKVPVDMVFEIDAPQPQVSFTPAGFCGSTIPVHVGLETDVSFGVTSPVFGDTIGVSWTPLPGGATLAQSGSTYTLAWTPTLDAIGGNVCFQATSSSGVPSLGNCCITMQVQTASLINISGIIRDFQGAQPDFNSPDGDAGTGFVATTLNASGKPTFRSGATPTTVASPASFNTWWNTTPPSLQKVNSLTLSNAGQADSRVYAFSSNSYYPIDGQLLGNEGAAHNGFFTFEVHSFITYHGGEVLQFSSADDLWVFIDSKLAVDLGGVHPAATASVSLDTLGLTAGSTYRFDVFYAHRGRHAPVLGLQIAQGVLCDPLAMAPPVAFSGQSSDFNFLGAAAPNADGSLRVLGPGVANASSAVWYVQPLPVASGFRAEFDFTITPGAQGGAEGLAFVLQSSGPGSRGASGANLGYGGIPNSVACELDSHTDSSMSDPSFEHISIHTGFAAPNSANESYAIGQSDNQPSLQFDNGSSQHVVVDYRPSVNPNGGFLLGYMNSNLAPVVEAQIDNQAFLQAVGAAAYLGFTSSSGTTTTATVDVRNWKLKVNLGVGGRVSTPPAAVAPGTMGQFVVQAVDPCGFGIFAGGQEDKWTVTMTGGPAPMSAVVIDNGDGTYSVRYTPPVAGVWHANVAFGGAPIPGSPVTITAPSPTLAAPVLTSPANGSTTTNLTIAVSGTGAPGASVVIYESGTIIATASVGTDGTFQKSLTFPVGTHTLSAAQSLGGATSDVSAVTFQIAPLAPSITSPANGASTPTPTVHVVGTGTPGATLVAFEGSAQIGSTVVGNDGSFSVDVTLARFPGGHGVTFSESLAGLTSASVNWNFFLVDAPPVISGVPADITVEAVAPLTPVTWTPPTAVDAIEGSVRVTCNRLPGGGFPVGVSSVLCSASDSFGHVANASFKVIVTDTTAPVFGPVSDVVAEATGPNGAAVTLAPLATDLVNGTVIGTCTPASGSTFALGTTPVTCTAKDSHNNTSAPVHLSVTVQDTTAPTLVLPPDITVEATGPSGATVTYAAPTATDLVDGNLSAAVHCSAASGSTFALGATSVVCTVTDAAGNTETEGFKVTVFDSTGPAFTAPPNQTVEAASASGVVVTYAVPTANDLVYGPTAVTCLPGSGNLFPLGDTIVQCTSADVPGNITTKTFKVTVVDTTPPRINVPADGAVEATGLGGAIVTYATPTATDAVDGTDAVVCTPASGSLFGLGVNVVLCQATDGHGNTGHGSFRITVGDSTPPLLALPATLTAEATGPAGAAVTFTVAATDLVDGADPVHCSASSGDTFPLGSTVVQCSASDQHGNGSTGSFTILVRDTTAPVIAGLPGPQTVNATSPAGAVVTYAQPTATDLVYGTDAVVCTPASGSTFPIGTSTVTCNVHDAAGNPASASFTITVRDNRAPDFGPTPSPKAYATSTAGAVVTYTAPTATDDVDGPVGVTCTPPSGSIFAPGSTTVTCTASDSSGHTATVTFAVIVTYQAPTDGTFYAQPINPDGSSIFKLGSTVPVKFALTGASAGITNLVAKISVPKVSNGIEGSFVEATSTSGGDSGNTFRYSSGQYIFNLSTKSLSQGTWAVKVDLGDGVDHTIHISLR